MSRPTYDLDRAGLRSRLIQIVAAIVIASVLAVGAASIVDRSGGNSSLGVPYEALLSLSVPTYDPASCPLCAQGLPVVKPGSRG